jgi:hypothetical protein
MNVNEELERIRRKITYFKADQVSQNLSSGPKETMRTYAESNLAPLEHEAGD